MMVGRQAFSIGKVTFQSRYVKLQEGRSMIIGKTICFQPREGYNLLEKIRQNLRLSHKILGHMFRKAIIGMIMAGQPAPPPNVYTPRKKA